MNKKLYLLDNWKPNIPLLFMSMITFTYSISRARTNFDAFMILLTYLCLTWSFGFAVKKERKHE